MIKQMFSGKRLGLTGFAIFLLVNTSALFAQASMESLVEQGNEAYNQGDYRKAIAFYEQTLSMGRHSAALYFNLGNAYYKLNDVAESVYYFEKAQQLNPKDENILVNSAFAKNMTIDSIEELPQSQIEQFKNQLYGLSSLDTWSVITVVLLLFLGSFSITFSIDQENKNTHYAILFSPEIEIWSEPNQQGEFLFTLHEGTKFQLLDDLEDWQKIRIANGSEGWIRNAVFRKLD